MTPTQKPKMPKPKPKLMPDKPKMPVKKQKPKDREALPMVSCKGVILFAQQGTSYAATFKN